MIWLIRTAMLDMMPAHQNLPGLAATHLEDFLQKLYRETTFLVWLGLVLGAVLYTLSPLLTVYLPLPSFLLPATLRDRHADRICGTRFYLLRQSVFLLKMYACMCWGQDPQVRQLFSIAPYPEDPGSFRGSFE